MVRRAEDPYYNNRTSSSSRNIRSGSKPPRDRSITRNKRDQSVPRKPKYGARQSHREEKEGQDYLTNTVVAFEEFGEPQEVLKLYEFKDKIRNADELKRNVVIQVEASSVSMIDVLIRRDLWSASVNTPYKTGCDLVGRVINVGSQADQSVQVGDMVCALGLSIGGNAKYAILPSSRVFPCPDDIHPTVAVCLVRNYMAAYQCLHRAGGTKIKAGDHVLVLGGAGAFGQACIQLAIAAGADEVYATGRSDRSKIIIESLGAQSLGRHPSEWLPEVKGSMDIVIDSVCSDRFRSSHRALNKRGKLVCVGATSVLLGGGNRGRGSGVPISVKFDMEKAASLLPNTSVYDVFSYFETKRDYFRKDLLRLFHLCRNHEISPKIAYCIPLNEVANAHDSIQMGDITDGTIVCLPFGPDERNMRVTKCREDDAAIVTEYSDGVKLRINVLSEALEKTVGKVMRDGSFKVQRVVAPPVKASLKSFDTRDETTLKSFDTRGETTLKSFDTRGEATFKSFDSRGEATFKSFDTRDETTLKSFDAPDEATLKSFDAPDEATLKSFDTRDETTLKSFDTRGDITLDTRDEITIDTKNEDEFFEPTSKRRQDYNTEEFGLNDRPHSVATETVEDRTVGTYDQSAVTERVDEKSFGTYDPSIVTETIDEKSVGTYDQSTIMTETVGLKLVSSYDQSFMNVEDSVDQRRGRNHYLEDAESYGDSHFETIQFKTNKSYKRGGTSAFMLPRSKSEQQVEDDDSYGDDDTYLPSRNFKNRNSYRGHGNRRSEEERIERRGRDNGKHTSSSGYSSSKSRTKPRGRSFSKGRTEPRGYSSSSSSTETSERSRSRGRTADRSRSRSRSSSESRPRRRSLSRSVSRLFRRVGSAFKLNRSKSAPFMRLRIKSKSNKFDDDDDSYYERNNKNKDSSGKRGHRNHRHDEDRNRSRGRDNHGESRKRHDTRYSSSGGHSRSKSRTAPRDRSSSRGRRERNDDVKETRQRSRSRGRGVDEPRTRSRSRSKSRAKNRPVRGPGSPDAKEKNRSNLKKNESTSRRSSSRGPTPREHYRSSNQQKERVIDRRGNMNHESSFYYDEAVHRMVRTKVEDELAGEQSGVNLDVSSREQRRSRREMNSSRPSRSSRSLSRSHSHKQRSSQK